MRRLFLFIYGLSGGAGLIYEILWTRQLTLLMGHSTAAVSTVPCVLVALGERFVPSSDLLPGEGS